MTVVISILICLAYSSDVVSWTSEGCQLDGKPSGGEVRCRCVHLTNFAVLVVSVFTIVFRYTFAVMIRFATCFVLCSSGGERRGDFEF